MTQRNPLNERYQTDERRGQTRKSAAAAKPKARAAASVYIEGASKQKAKKGFFSRVASQGKVQEQKLASKKAPDRRTSPEFYNPPTPEYRRVRKIWWIFIIIAIVGMMVSFFLNSWVGPSAPTTVAVLVISYVSIFISLYIDFFKARKLRRQYQMEMSVKTKAHRRAEKEQHQRASQQAKLAAKKAAEAPVEEKETKKASFMASLFKKKDA